MDLAIYVLIISFLLGFTAMRLWSKDSPQWKRFPTFYTFLPALICIVVTLLKTGELSFDNFSFQKFDVLYIVLGMAIPLILYVVSYLIQRAAGVYALKSAIKWREVIPAFFINVVIVIFFVAGEEIGWRGFIQTPLMATYGKIVGIILLGLIWGIWHAPVALRGHNMSQYYWVEAFILYPYMCVCYSFALACLTTQSGSMWPALLFHSTNNTLGSIGIQYIERKSPCLKSS